MPKLCSDQQIDNQDFPAQCNDCGHKCCSCELVVGYGPTEDGKNLEMRCPKCGSPEVTRIENQEIPQKMKVVYIAHPIGGDVLNNLQKITEIVHDLNKRYTDIVPFVPYYVDCLAEHTHPGMRDRCIANDHELLSRGFVDEMWLFGDCISAGMLAEVQLAHAKGIKVFPQTYGTETMYNNYIDVKSTQKQNP